MLTSVLNSATFKASASPRKLHLVPTSNVFAFCGSRLGLSALLAEVLSWKLLPPGGCWEMA
ncbi:hypothetical protein D3C72_2480010 [compost metagenome]